ncbi:hypothetical protein TW95_gp1471 [Pandoravirus inopinatum]|uniref:Uncharacterized protein n=1 Tax=Pandoravirus inopinatum TaxID=1605721 RepID=A0A0B5J8H5_9VIRU|nr:hypothetical protein TW95_gp1471 [Pandoravirus inopinatum]AJF98205.1 hypothetical protein [Pandoravirus inopinatum]
MCWRVSLVAPPLFRAVFTCPVSGLLTSSSLSSSIRSTYYRRWVTFSFFLLKVTIERAHNPFRQKVFCARCCALVFFSTKTGHAAQAGKKRGQIGFGDFCRHVPARPLCVFFSSTAASLYMPFVCGGCPSQSPFLWLQWRPPASPPSWPSPSAHAHGKRKVHPKKDCRHGQGTLRKKREEGGERKGGRHQRRRQRKKRG